MQRLFGLFGAIAMTVAVAGCGDDDDAVSDGAAGDSPAAEQTDAAADDAAAGDDGSDDAAAGGGGGGGTLTFDGEDIALDSARCTFEEQDAAAGGGTILFVAQANGTTGAGEAVLVDVSRYSEDSQFAGDAVSLNVGEIGTGASFRGSEPTGTVSEDGSTVSATDFPVKSDDDFTDERTISFSIDCG